MSLFEIKWIRRLIRRHTNPIPFNRADMWKRRLSVAYAILGWNAFGLVCYMCYKGKSDWAKYYGLKTELENSLSPAQQFSKTLNVDKGKIIRVKGFTVVDELEFNNLDTTEE